MASHLETNRKPLFSMNIKKKLFLSFLLILIIPSITIGITSYLNAQQKIKEKIQLSAKENVGIIDRYLTSYLKLKVHDTAYFAGSLNQNNFTGKKVQNTVQTFQQYIALHPEVASIYIGSDKGDFSMYPQQKLPANFDTRTRPWYTQAKAKPGQTIITDPFIDAFTGKVLIAVAQTLKDGSGVVGMDLNMDDLKVVTGGIKIGKYGYPSIISPDGDYIVHPTAKPGTKAKGSWVKPLLAKQNGRISYTLNGQQKELDFITNKLTGLRIAGTMNVNEVQQDSQSILITTLTVVGLFILIGVLIVYLLIRSITRPLNQLVLSTEKLSEGDLTQKFVAKSNDEFSHLGNSFNKMAATLRKLIQDIGEKADLLAASSEELMASSEENNAATEQIANSTQKVTSGSEHQTTMVKESNEVIKGMSTDIGKTTQRSKDVADKSVEAAGIVQNGNDTLQLSTEQMTNIHDTVAHLGIVIKSLGERSKEINQIIEVISGIASQTNLLALNAAIEAARAGEHGQGFAVVADEVRKLAEQSSQATKDIRQLITSIQTDTDQAVTSMDHGTTEVDKGIDLVKNAGDAFLQMKQFIEAVTREIQDVSVAMEETGHGAEHVVQLINGIEEITVHSTKDIQEVSAATEEQLASMQEIAASASSLSHMAEELQDSIKKFKI